MRDIRRPPKQPAQRANSKTPPSHSKYSKPPSQKIALAVTVQQSRSKSDKKGKAAAAQPPLHNPHTYSLEGKHKSRKTGI
jgi:hypothetical protein